MKKSKFILLTFTLLVFLGFSLFFIPPEVKGASGDGWYIPDLEDYTFNIPAESEDLIFAVHDFETGNFVEFLTRVFDFGVSQNSNGALDFVDIFNAFQWIGVASFLDGYGLTPMFYDSLPSYISYNIYNDLDLTEYKGAVNVHVIKYRLDFRGNYSMLLNDYIYDIVFTLEVIYELYIDYFGEFDFTRFIRRGYYIHWYDMTEMEEYKLYTPMHDNLLQFQLRNVDYMQDYQQGYNAGFEEGHEVGYDLGYNEGHEAGYNEGYDVGYDVGIEVAQPKMDILLITLIMFLLSIFIYFKFRIKWVLIATILLWFVPIFLVENLFIKIFSVIMILVTITITFFNNREEDIE